MRFLFLKLISTIAAVFFLVCCAPSRLVKPLKKKEQVVGLTFGGPTINFSGAPIPIPFTTVYYANGITTNITVFGSLHTTSLLFANAQTDIGATYTILKLTPKFTITGNTAFQMAYNYRNNTKLKVWPSMDLNATYNFKNKNSFVYGGVNTWVELGKYKAHEQNKTRTFLPNCQIGYQFVNTKFTHQLEIKYLGIGIPNTPNVVDYIGAGKKGAFGLYYGVSYKF